MDRRDLLAGAVATPFVIASAAARAASPSELLQAFTQALTAHDMDAFAALFADDYVNHQTSAAVPPAPAGVSAKAGTVAFFAARVKGLPDLRVTIESQLATGDRAAASFVYEGTHSGVYLGVPPTGKHLRFTSCDIFRIEDSRIAEHWGMGDIAGIMAQLKG